MSQDITLEILSDGRIRFKRGSKEHNDNMIQVLSKVIEDPETMEGLKNFFSESEEVELLFGDTIFCG